MKVPVTIREQINSVLEFARKKEIENLEAMSKEQLIEELKGFDTLWTSMRPLPLDVEDKSGITKRDHDDIMSDICEALNNGTLFADKPSMEV
jgi:hypothetical protein